jgi:hypothetical protein
MRRTGASGVRHLKYAIKQLVSPRVDHEKARQVFTAAWLAMTPRQGRPGP